MENIQNWFDTYASDYEEKQPIKEKVKHIIDKESEEFINEFTLPDEYLKEMYNSLDESIIKHEEQNKRNR